MQVAVSIARKICPLKKTLEVNGWLLPWEVLGYAADFEIACKAGGVFDLSNWTCIEISGPDARDYLQRMSTLDFKKLSAGDVRHGAFLTGKATVIALGIFQVREHAFGFWVPESQKGPTLSHLDQFHFAEKLEFRDAFSESALLGLWNPTPALQKEFQLEVLADGKFEWRRWRSMECEIWRDSVRPSLYFLRTQRSLIAHFLEHLREISVVLLGGRLFEYFRIEAAIPQVGPEANDQTIILETGFEEAVSRNKGCYPGQEVVERIFTYGQVNKKLFAIKLSGTIPPLPCRLVRNGKEVGLLVTAESSPVSSGESVGLGFLHKDVWATKDVPFTF